MWWKTYSDPYEPYLLFRKNSMGGMWTVGYLIALYALVVALGQYALPQLAIPVALGGLYVFMSYVTGVVGMAVLAPIMSYAWFCLDWLAVYGVGPVSLTAALAGLECAMIMAALLIGAPQVRAYLLVLVAVEGFFFLFLSSGSYALLALGGPDNESAIQTGHIIDALIRGTLWVTVAVAAIVLVIVLVSAVRSKDDMTEVKRQLKGDALLFVVGVVPPLAGSLLAHVNPQLGMLGVLVLHAAIAVAARMRGIERVCWALVPMVLLATLGIIARAPLDMLPPWAPGAVLLQAVQDGPLGGVAATCVMPLLEGTAKVLGPLLVLPLQRVGTAIPNDALVLYLLGLYALAFLASVVMGTIVGVADLKAYAASRKAPAAGQEVAEAPAVAPDAAGAGIPEPQLMPSWMAGGPLRKLLRRGQGENPEGAPTDSYVQYERRDGTLGRRAGSQRGLLPRELRLALGLPVVEKLGKRVWHHWDEQLSGSVPCFEDVHVSEASRRNLIDRIKRPVRKGLWWKVFEDDGRMELIPKGAGGDLLAVWLPLVVLLRISPAGHASLVMPVTLILCVMSMCHVLGLFGTIVTGPLLVYGWTSLVWLIGQGDLAALMGTGSFAEMQWLFAVITVLTVITGTLRGGANWTLSFALYAMGGSWIIVRQYETGIIDEQTARTWLGYLYLASMAIAVVFTLWSLYKEASLLRRWPEARSDELASAALTVAGAMPLAIAVALSGVGALPALIGATVAYVALAVAGRMHSPKGLSCLFLPLLVGAAAWAVTAADVAVLPPSTMSDRLVALCGSRPLAFLAHGAQSVMKGCTLLLERPVRAAVAFAINYANDYPIPAEALPLDLLQVFCLFAGILVIASLMGIGVSMLEGARPQLVEDALGRERRVLDALTQPAPTGAAQAEEAQTGEKTLDEASIGEDSPDEAPTEGGSAEGVPPEEAPVDGSMVDEPSTEGDSLEIAD